METMGEVIARNESFYPDSEAYVQAGHRLTHKQYAERVRTLGSALSRLGVAQQHRISILSMNSIEYCELLGACEWNGYIAVTINFRLTENEIAYVLQDSDPRVLIFEEQYADTIERLREQFPAIELYICIGDAPDWAIAYELLFDKEESIGETTNAICGRAAASSPGDYASLIYTSGTTGRPKGVVSTHRRLMSIGRLLAGEQDMSINGRTLVVTPLFHIGGQSMRLSQSFLSGTVVIIRNFDVVEVLETIQTERINIVFLVAAQLQQLLEAPDLDSYQLSSLLTLNVAGAPIPVPLLKRGMERLGEIFIVQYGMTEGMCTTLYKHELKPHGTPEEIGRVASVGHVMPGGRLRIIDEQGNDCPPRMPGEVVLQSESMLEAYWNNHPATIEALRGGWLHTGDIGYLDDNGYLFLVDRKKDVIISGGENIYSREVEEILHEHPCVAEAAVIGIPDERWGEAVKAVVVLNKDDQVSATDLIEHCKTHIARYKCPKLVAFVDELPRLVTGKVNKVSLREHHR